MNTSRQSTVSPSSARGRITLLFAPVIIGVLSITYRELVQKPEAYGEVL